MHDPILVSPREAARLLGVSRSQVYRLLTSGELTAHKLGRRTLIDVESIRTYGASLPAWAPESDG